LASIVLILGINKEDFDGADTKKLDAIKRDEYIKVLILHRTMDAKPENLIIPLVFQLNFDKYFI